MHVMQVSHMYPRFRSDPYGITMRDQIVSLQDLEAATSCVISPIPWVPWGLRRFSERWREYTRCPHDQVWDGVEVIYPRYAALPRGLAARMIQRQFTMAAARALEACLEEQRFDLIHAHMALPDGHAAMELSEQISCPFVVTIQSTDLDLTTQQGGAARKRLARVLAAASAVISPSPRLTRAYTRLFDGAVATIPYGIHAADPHGRRGRIPNMLPQVPVVLTVARLIETKGIDILLRAVACLSSSWRPLHLVVVGDGRRGV